MAHDAELEAQIDQWRGYVQRARRSRRPTSTRWRTTCASRSPTCARPGSTTTRRSSSRSSAWATSTRSRASSPASTPTGCGSSSSSSPTTPPPSPARGGASSRSCSRSPSARAWRSGRDAWFGETRSARRNVGLLVLPFLAAYLAWKRQSALRPWRRSPCRSWSSPSCSTSTRSRPRARPWCSRPCTRRSCCGAGGARVRRRALALRRPAHGLRPVHRRARDLLHAPRAGRRRAARPDGRGAAARGCRSRAGVRGLGPAVRRPGRARRRRVARRGQAERRREHRPGAHPGLHPADHRHARGRPRGADRLRRLVDVDRDLLILMDAILVLVLACSSTRSRRATRSRRRRSSTGSSSSWSSRRSRSTP